MLVVLKFQKFARQNTKSIITKTVSRARTRFYYSIH